MTQEKADKQFEQTGDLRDYLINSMDAYLDQIAGQKTLSDTAYNHMKFGILGSKMIINTCFIAYDKKELLK